MKRSEAPFVSPATRFEAKEVKATMLPSDELEEPTAQSLPMVTPLPAVSGTTVDHVGAGGPGQAVAVRAEAASTHPKANKRVDLMSNSPKEPHGSHPRWIRLLQHGSWVVTMRAQSELHHPKTPGGVCDRKHEPFALRIRAEHDEVTGRTAKVAEIDR